MSIEANGFIVHDNELIWSTGATEIEAARGFLDEMAANFKFTPDDLAGMPWEAETPSRLVSLIKLDNHIAPATQALIDLVSADSGDVMWVLSDAGVACTREERDSVGGRETVRNVRVAGSLATMEVGQRVKIVRRVEIYPTGIFEIGLTGTVTADDGETIGTDPRWLVTMDEPQASLTDWDNALQVYENDADYGSCFARDFALVEG